MHGIPNFTDKAHDFNAWMSRLAPAATVMLLVLVVVMQQFLRSITDPTLSEPPEAVKSSEEVTDPGIRGFVLDSKAAVKIKAARPGMDIPWAEMVAQIEAEAESRTDRLRAAVVAGELVGKEAAIERLNRLKAEIAPGSELSADADWLLRLYTKGRDSLPEAALQSLVDRHGWFGDLAAAFGQPAGEQHRARSTSGMGDMVTVQVAQAATEAVTSLAAIGAFVGLFRRWNSGQYECQFSRSSLPPGIYIETFAAEQLLFLFLLIMQVMTLWLTGTASVVALAFNELLMWLTPLCLVWPWLRGVRWVLLAEDLGLHAGEGVAKEISWGCLGYLSTIPVYFVLHLVFAAVQAATDTGEASSDIPGFPTFQSPLSGSWIPIVLGALGAVIFAPIFEEIIFRGVLYRFLRARWGVAISVGVSAFVFGFIHPYDIQGLIQVSVMGVCLGLMREWRGSLIAPIVAHALHNGHLTLFEIWEIAAIT